MVRRMVIFYLAAGGILALWTLLGTDPGWGHAFAWGWLGYLLTAVVESLLHVRYFSMRKQALAEQALADEVEPPTGEQALTEVLHYAMVWTKWPRIIAALGCFVAVVVWLVRL